MSGKRWALRADISVPDPGTGFFTHDCFEEVHTYDLATESAVPHDVLRAWRNVLDKHFWINEYNEIGNYLPKPRPTLREWLTADGYGEGWIAKMAKATGIDPDKRVEG